MAHPSRLSLWTYLHRERFQLIATNFSWPKKFNCDWFDFEVQITTNSKTYEGRGTALDTEIAFDTATSEAFERSVYELIGETRTNYSGFGAHLSLKQAADSAICELIERDSFFSHFLTQTAFIEPVELRLLGDELGTLESYLNQHHVKLESRTMCVPKEFSAVITVAIGTEASRPFGIFLGLGCKKNTINADDGLKSALRSSAIECLRNLTDWLENESTLPLNALEFGLIQKPTPSDHRRLAKNIQHNSGILSLLSSKKEKLFPLDWHKIKITKIQNPEHLSGGIPLIFAGASHPECIHTEFGNPKISPLTLRRLSQFLSSPVDDIKIFTSPHPIG